MAEKTLNEWDDFIGFTQDAEDAAHEKFNLEEALRWLDKDFPARSTCEELGNAIARAAKSSSIAHVAVRTILRTILESELGREIVKTWLSTETKSAKSHDEATQSVSVLQMTDEEKLGNAIVQNAKAFETAVATIEATLRQQGGEPNVENLSEADKESAIEEAAASWRIHKETREILKSKGMLDKKRSGTIAQKAREAQTMMTVAREILEQQAGKFHVKDLLSPETQLETKYKEAVKIALVSTLKTLKVADKKSGEFLERLLNGRIDKELATLIVQLAETFETALFAVKATLKQQVGSQNVSNWLTPGTKLRMSRKMAIETAFVLRMTYEKADEFLSRLWLDKFHMRNVVDMICRYGLENGWTYEETSKMIEVFSYLDHYNPDPDITDIAVRNATRRDGLTSYLNSKFPNSSTPEELEAFIRKNEQYFGSFRRTAHVKFMKFFGKIKDLIETDSEWDDGQAAYNEKDKMEIIRRKIVGNMHDIANGNFNAIFLDLITARIPARQKYLSDIVKKHEGGTIQVDKKLLILTWLACPSGNINLFQKGETAYDNFRDHVLTLNKSVLRPCGMADIDSRHPFDWIILNALHVGHVRYKEGKDAYGDADALKDILQKTFERMEAMEL